MSEPIFKYKDPTLSPEESMRIFFSNEFGRKIRSAPGYNPAWSNDNLEEDYPYGVGEASFLL